MSRIVIEGGKGLSGSIRAQGSKNAALPIIAASVLCPSECELSNCPNLSDVGAALDIIRHFGGKGEYHDGCALVNSKDIHKCEIPEELMCTMRSSVLFLGPLIARLGKAVISYPGGCSIGLRPIDLHLKAFRQMGVNIDEIGGKIYCRAEKLASKRINLLFPSVGATENIMMLSATLPVETTIVNAAREPEIVDLQNFLCSMGAKISGAGTETIHILGVENLQNVSYNIMSDRIFAATVMCGVVGCGGDVTIRNISPGHLDLILSMLAGMGASISQGSDYIRIRMKDRPIGLGKVMTSPYPGFPTDAQALFMSSVLGAEGTTVFVENIFESRYKHVPQLIKMGADIIVDGRLAVVSGCNYIQGASVEATDLRGGAALVLAGLSAIGTTTVSGLCHIDRGYECIEKTFGELGASIKRI